MRIARSYFMFNREGAWKSARSKRDAPSEAPSAVLCATRKIAAAAAAATGAAGAAIKELFTALKVLCRKAAR